MKGKIAVMTVVIGCLLTPGIARSQVPGMEKMEAYMEWATASMFVMWTTPVLAWGHGLYEAGTIGSEDAIKVAEAVKSLTEVFEKMAGEFKNATMRTETVAYARAIIAQAGAYVAYFKGDEKSMEDVEKYGKQSGAHLEAIGKYLEME